MKYHLTSLAFLLFLTFSCSSASKSVSPQPAIAPRAVEQAAGISKSTDMSALPSVEERKIARNGSLSLVVQNVIDTRDRIAALAKNLNGYVVSSNFSGSENEISGTISIRVPSDKFDQALADLRAMAIRVDSESTTSKDVTEEFIDLQSRLKNAEATEKQYVALLSKATDVDSTLRVYERIKQIRQEIEQIKGRIQFLEQTSSTSIITVRLDPATTAKPVVRSGWDIREQLKAALRGMVITIQVIGTVVIWLVIFSPIWAIPLGFIIWLRRRKKSKSLPPEPPPAEQPKPDSGS